MINFLLSLSLSLPVNLPSYRADRPPVIECAGGETISVDPDDLMSRDKPIKKFNLPDRTIWVDERGYRNGGLCITRFIDYRSIKGPVDAYRTDCPGAFGDEKPISAAPQDLRKVATTIETEYARQFETQ